jgi:hypothetical protein
MSNRGQTHLIPLRPASLLALLDDIAVARDLAQLEQHSRQAYAFNDWLQQALGYDSTASGATYAAAGSNKRVALEVRASRVQLMSAHSMCCACKQPFSCKQHWAKI